MKINIHIEFCVQWNYEPEFERVSNLIYSLVPDANISSNENGHRTGAFEVTINNSLVFSKKTEDIQKSLSSVNSVLAKAVKKGLIKKEFASRKLSSLSNTIDRK